MSPIAGVSRDADHPVAISRARPSQLNSTPCCVAGLGAAVDSADAMTDVDVTRAMVTKPMEESR
jgi:hypothetical protein